MRACCALFSVCCGPAQSGGAWQAGLGRRGEGALPAPACWVGSVRRVCACISVLYVPDAGVTGAFVAAARAQRGLALHSHLKERKGNIDRPPAVRRAHSPLPPQKCDQTPDHPKNPPVGGGHQTQASDTADRAITPPKCPEASPPLAPQQLLRRLQTDERPHPAYLVHPRPVCACWIQLGPCPWNLKRSPRRTAAVFHTGMAGERAQPAGTGIGPVRSRPAAPRPGGAPRTNSHSAPTLADFD